MVYQVSQVCVVIGQHSAEMLVPAASFIALHAAEWVCSYVQLSMHDLQSGSVDM